MTRVENDRGYTTYDPATADQLTCSSADDVRPISPWARRSLARAVAQQAVIYGLPSVYQYASMCAQCAPDDEEAPWRLNELEHARRPADARYQPFRVPNVDTLYSNGWLDLTAGPVIIDLPDFGDRYYTLNFLDAYSNASNVSARTHPVQPRRLMVATTTWAGDIPATVDLLRVATPVMWLLLRIQYFDVHEDLHVVHQIQDDVAVNAPATGTRRWPVVDQGTVETSPDEFLVALNASLRINGVPHTDAAHVDQFRILGVSPSPAVTRPEADPDVVQGIRDGFHDAMRLLKESRPLLGRKTASGWTRVLDKGAHGTNFVARAVMNLVGLGANVVEENCSYNTYVDANATVLDGGVASYRIGLSTPPPAHAFWSITLYDADTGLLYDAPGGRHSIGTAVNRTDEHDGFPDIVVSTDRPQAADQEWLPCPAKPFFLVLRIYQPARSALREEWTPPPVEKLEERATAKPNSA
ncbi:DUF1254 domain-containing protein [Gordonia sp. KTR9]|uniref:DUF1254 domain-containing protein n=1 Tax=Gordonia sp. KTR9 TaxID=337191 RepID=UPI00027DE1F3|nr:DUF1254 domain-containing protein [Gordonia sp. KTR9]AFR51293.1 putative lipoprotein [Gordonia sp. KTR9]